MRQQTLSLLLGLTAVLMWSTVATAFKLALVHLSPSQLLLLASVSSVLCLALILAIQGRMHLVGRSVRQRWRFLLLVGLLNPFLYYLVLFQAYALLPAQQAQALNYTWAISLALLAVPLLKQRLLRQDLLAMGLGYCGALVIATKGQVWELQFESGLGVTLALLSTLLWAFYWIMNTRNQDDPIASLLGAFLFSLPFSAVYCWWADGWPSLSWQTTLAAAYVGVFEMGLAFVCWVIALKKTDNTARISNLIFISPFLSLYFIAQVLGETIEMATYAGLLMIIIGLLIQQWRRPREDTNE